MIAKNLEKKCTEIDSAIEDKKMQMQILEQYKKSLIYEYVTGKKEVE
jgi:type I restriction enzyme, S subunit